uniref:Uncharacterized protein n=1 Tax=Rhizophora mucronata TaxID=61149 RepID=A0A2P2NHZ0_RHIMU
MTKKNGTHILCTKTEKILQDYGEKRCPVS